MLLRLAGHDIAIAYDGEEALEAAATQCPDVILLDIGLPRLNGFDVCRRIRQHPWGKGVVMIALTGWGQQEDRRKSAEAGFDGHLVKPVDHAELMRLVAGHAPQVEGQHETHAVAEWRRHPALSRFSAPAGDRESLSERQEER